MTDLDKALATQLANMQQRTGKSLDELARLIHESGLTKHGELVSMLKSTLGMGHGDANTLVHVVKKGVATSGAPAGGRAGGDRTRVAAGDATGNATGDAAGVLDALYTGPKAALRPIHDAVLAMLNELGAYETAPKKTYVSYRRKKQFCMVGPATNTRVEVGLNMKGVPATDRLEALPPGQMCQYKVRITDVTQVDAELRTWLGLAFAAAG
jgi:hypothetical protein